MCCYKKRYAEKGRISSKFTPLELVLNYCNISHVICHSRQQCTDKSKINWMIYCRWETMLQKEGKLWATIYYIRSKIDDRLLRTTDTVQTFTMGEIVQWKKIYYSNIKWYFNVLKTVLMTWEFYIFYISYVNSDLQ